MQDLRAKEMDARGPPVPAAPGAGGTGGAWTRPEVQPLLVWLVNNWAIIAPKLDTALARLHRANDVFVVDVRLDRGGAYTSLDAAAVFDKGVGVELEGLRNVLMNHPFLFKSSWCKQLTTQTKQEVKSMAKKQDPASVAKGILICFAYGDSPELGEVLPDFSMNVAQFFSGDLKTVAEHNLAEHRRALEVQRQVAMRKQLLAAGVPAATAKSLTTASSSSEKGVGDVAADATESGGST